MNEEVVNTGAAAQSFLSQINIDLAAIIEIIVIIFLCIVSRFFLKKTKKKIVSHIQTAENEKKLNINTSHFFLTLIPVGESIIKFIILIIGILSCLSAVHISVSPFVYCLGFASVGISLGAQDTFTDIIRGILTLAEGKISLGDRISINGSTGYVETLTIRQITIRHSDGSLESFPFSKIGTIQNFSINYNIMIASFCIAPDSDITEFRNISQKVFETMKKDKVWKNYITKKTEPHPDLEFEQVNNTGITIVIRIRTKADPGGNFTSEFNRRMLEELQKTNMLRIAKF